MSRTRKGWASIATAERFVLELLERRRLLSMTLENGLLTITGTDESECFDLEYREGKLEVWHQRGENDATAQTVEMGEFAGVQAISIDAKGGNDRDCFPLGGPRPQVP